MKRLQIILKWVGISFIALVLVLVILRQRWNAKYNNPNDYIVYNEASLADEGIQLIEANGLQFAYLEAGQGPLVLLAHGFPDSAYGYVPLMESLAGEGYHVVAYFQRGYAPTEIPANGDYTALTLGQDVLSLIEAFGEEEAIVVGHDWGATAVYSAANQNPDRIEKMVTLAIPHPRITEITPELLQRAPHFLQLQFGFISEWAVRRNDWAYLDQLIAYWSPGWSAEPMLRDSKKSFGEPGRLKAALGYYEALLQSQDGLLILQQQTTVPTLTIAGADDGPLDIGQFDNSQSAYTGTFKLIVLEDVGHFVHQEAPQDVFTEIKAFLEAEEK